MSVVIFIVSVIALVALDQYSKMLAITHLKDQPAIPIIKDVFELHYVENRGAAFGMFQGKQWFFILVTLAVFIFIVYYYFKVFKPRRFRPLRFCLVLISAGAIGNLIDRVFRSHIVGTFFERMNDTFVVDYFYFKLIDFPVFNVADCYVVVGAILMLLLLLTKYRKELLED